MFIPLNLLKMTGEIEHSAAIKINKEPQKKVRSTLPNCANILMALN